MSLSNDDGPFTQTGDLIQSVGPDGRVFDANRRWRETLGYSEAELPSLNVFQMIHPDQRARWVAAFGRLMQGEEGGLAQVTFIAKDGRPVELEGSVNPRVENGALVSVRGVFRDVSARKEAEVALRASEAELRAVFEGASVGIGVLNLELKLVRSNPALAEMLGYTPDELMQLEITDVVLPPDRDALVARGKTLVEGETDQRTVEDRMLRKDGSTVWAKRTTLVLKNGDGQPHRLVSLVTDITDLKSVEEALRQSEAEFRTLVETCPSGIVVVDEQGHLTLVNAQFERDTGYDREELHGKSIEVLVPDRHARVHPGHRQEFQRSPERRKMGAGRDIFVRRKDGSEFPAEIALAPFRSAAGSMTLASIMNISERKQAEQSLKRTVDQLQVTNAELAQFAYVASHDLQEPLRAIAGGVQILERRYRERLDPAAEQLIRHTVEGTTRMQSVIHDLLAYSRVTHGAPSWTPTDLERALTTATTDLHNAIEQSGAVITHDPLPTLNADDTRFRQLFENLLGNAIKFCGDRRPVVHICVERRPDGWIFGVRDNGIGIEPQYADRIFTLFQRLHTRDQYPGTGIGLAICKKIVEGFGGRIWVESALGQGATFWFTLPDR